MGYAIVIDVSVARSAGTSGKPEPEACRRVLAAIRDFNHRVAMSAEVYEEWMKSETEREGHHTSYASLIAIRWLVDMQSQGRVDHFVLETNSELRQQCIQGLQNKTRVSSSAGPVAKDFHLVETALKADKRVLSLDGRMFRHLGHLEDIANQVCEVMWVNPITNPAEEWLQNDASDVLEYHVCRIRE